MAREPVHPLDKARKKKPAGPKQGPTRPTAGKPKRPKRRRGRQPDSGPPEGTVRIQKFLAASGVDSRRACEELVAEGRVRVNGRVVRELPAFVTPDADRVEVDGVTVRPSKAPEPVYILLNKPKGVVCTNKDPAGRPRAIDLVPDAPTRVFPVGRLDADSTGIILLTNDGDLANRLTHPRYGLTKTYVVEVDGAVAGDAIEKLKRGLYLDGKRTAGAAVKVLRRHATRTLLEVKLTEGRNREIRRTLARLNYKVRALRRTAIGPVTDRGIKTGNSRPLTPKEVAALKRATRTT